MAQIQAAQRDELHLPSIWEIIFGLVVGIFFIAFSFPIGLTKLGNAMGWSLVRDTGATAKGILYGLFGATSSSQFSSFNILWLALIVGLLLYLAALTSLSLKHQRFDLVGSGFLSLVVATAILNLLAWLVYIAVIVLYVVLIVLGWIVQVLAFLFAKIGAFLGFIAGIFGRFFGFIFESAWWIIGLLLVVIVFYLAVKYRAMVFKSILWVLGACGILGGLYLLFKLLQLLSPVFAFIGRILGAIFQFLAVIILFLFSLLLILLAVFVVYGIGAWVIDLFRGAWKSGNDIRGVIIGSLSIGTALALILLETNLYNLVNFPFYPSQFVSFVTTYLHQSSPIVDMIMALLIVGVAIIGVLRNLPQLQEEPGLGEFQFAMFMAGVGVIIGVTLIAIAGQTEHN